MSVAFATVGVATGKEKGVDIRIMGVEVKAHSNRRDDMPSIDRNGISRAKADRRAKVDAANSAKWRWDIVGDAIPYPMYSSCESCHEAFLDILNRHATMLRDASMNTNGVTVKFFGPVAD